jgi:hypothetical protein
MSYSSCTTKWGSTLFYSAGRIPMGVIRMGTPKEVYVETRKLMEAAKERRSLLSSGTGTTPMSP